ncbi:epsin-3-like [Andrographis paniculata]|uniref:epsin-3-like n=1 Tax=Andrographis paniculata TaxID=175694 RepID=UPI0021E7B699|nr:epsin-3-like [Andrographis paniculata]
MSSILGSGSGSGGGGDGGGAATFHEFKKQASFFLKEKIKTARLALTDVTPAQLLAEEATNGNIPPDARTLKMISKAAFEVDDYWRIVDILHKRLVKFDSRNWRPPYTAVVVVEHLVTHGPERAAEEFRSDSGVIAEMLTFHHLDDKGFDWGLSVRNKSQRVLKLLEKGSFLKEERDKARRISRGIKGFGSFSHRGGGGRDPPEPPVARCKSAVDGSSEDFFSIKNECIVASNGPLNLVDKDLKIRVNSKENFAPNDEIVANAAAGQDVSGKTGDQHPFDDAEVLTATPLLSTAR